MLPWLHFVGLKIKSEVWKCATSTSGPTLAGTGPQRRVYVMCIISAGDADKMERKRTKLAARAERNSNVSAEHVIDSGVQTSSACIVEMAAVPSAPAVCLNHTLALMLNSQNIRFINFFSEFHEILCVKVVTDMKEASTCTLQQNNDGATVPVMRL